jgi:hypothetical protein
MSMFNETPTEMIIRQLTDHANSMCFMQCAI